MQAEPHPTYERACRAWRNARTGREAWARFLEWLARARPQSDGDATGWCDKGLGSHHLLTHPAATRLVLFQKHQVMREFLPDGRGSDWATRWRIATGTPCFWARPYDVAVVRAHARLVGGPVGLVGDLDPHGLHMLGALRSGSPAAPDLRGKKLRVDWLGVDDEWLARVRRTSRSLKARLIRMPWVERGYWGIIKRMMPDVRALVGEQSFELLDGGLKAESDAFTDVMVPMLRARLKRATSA